jgi:hypothetical protein
VRDGRFMSDQPRRRMTLGEDISDEGNFDEIMIQLLTNSLMEEESWHNGSRSGLFLASRRTSK